MAGQNLLISSLPFAHTQPRRIDCFCFAFAGASLTQTVGFQAPVACELLSTPGKAVDHEGVWGKEVCSARSEKDETNQVSIQRLENALTWSSGKLTGWIRAHGALGCEKDIRGSPGCVERMSAWETVVVGSKTGFRTELVVKIL
ncbi:hypothetical protein B0H16DRAFT_1455126 [Mycena metata]|uniref:Uncharacterized protein n=1 Tax=Mycena metata TaxID=1033252 RepID=A0AAD7NK86_9AGAR|nr:hypothetical protein B0H16DRAFT_1455126 [Mycena metata]